MNSLMMRGREFDRGFDRPAPVPRPMASILDRAHEIRAKYDRLKETQKGKIEKAKDVGRVAVRTAEVAVGAAAFGAIQGRYGAVKVLGVPVDLGAAVVAHAAAFFLDDDDLRPHLQGLGDGAFASYAFTWGRGKGKEMRAKAGLPALVSGGWPAGALADATGGGSLSESELPISAT